MPAVQCMLYWLILRSYIIMRYELEERLERVCSSADEGVCPEQLYGKILLWNPAVKSADNSIGLRRTYGCIHQYKRLEHMPCNYAEIRLWWLDGYCRNLRLLQNDGIVENTAVDY